MHTIVNINATADGGTIEHTKGQSFQSAIGWTAAITGYTVSFRASSVGTDTCGNGHHLGHRCYHTVDINPLHKRHVFNPLRLGGEIISMSEWNDNPYSPPSADVTPTHNVQLEEGDHKFARYLLWAAILFVVAWAVVLRLSFAYGSEPHYYGSMSAFQ